MSVAQPAQIAMHAPDGIQFPACVLQSREDPGLEIVKCDSIGILRVFAPGHPDFVNGEFVFVENLRRTGKIRNVIPMFVRHDQDIDLSACLLLDIGSDISNEISTPAIEV